MIVELDGIGYELSNDTSDEADGTRVTWLWEGLKPWCPACDVRMDPCVVTADPLTARKAEPTYFVVCEHCDERFEIVE